MKPSFIICTPYILRNGQLLTGGHTFEEYEALLAETNRILRMSPKKARRAPPKAKAKPKRLMPYQVRGRLLDMQRAATLARNERAATAASRRRGPDIIRGPWSN